MKQLRLRKIWVVLAAVVLLIPLLVGRTDMAKATNPTEPPTDDNPTSSYEIKFIVDGEPDDGESMPQFSLRPVENTETGFTNPNGARLKMQIWVNGDKADDIENIYEPEWTISVNGTPITDNTLDLDGMTVVPFKEAGKDWPDIAEREYDISATASGLLRFSVHVDLKYTENGVEKKTPIDREALITVPIQILNKNPQGSYFNYVTTETGQNVDLWVNNVKSSQMFWFYYDFTTDELVKLEDFNSVDTSKATLSTGSLGLVSGLKSGSDDDPQNRTPVEANSNHKVYSYTANINQNYGGMTRVVGRIYLNNDRTSDKFIEQTFDIFIKAETKDVTESAHYVDMEYGQTKSFNSISNDRGNSLEWYLEDKGNSTEQPTVVDLVNGVGAVGRYYGEERVYLTPVPVFRQYRKFETLDPDLRDYVTFRTAFCVLNGDVEEYRERSTGFEVVDVNGKLTLSTNVKGSSNNNYEWYWLEDNGTEASFLDTTNEYIEVSGITTFGGSWSGISVTGKKSGEVRIKCKVTEKDSGKVHEETTRVKVVDAMTLSESRRSVVKGESFQLVATTTDLAGTITWTSANPQYVTVDPTGKEVTVTGVEVTGNNYIEIRATHVPSGRTATCRVRVVEAMSPVTIEGDKIISKDNLGELWLDFDGATPNYNKDDLKWVIKDKDGVDANTIIQLTQSEVDPTKATVGGLAAGEAYVAVVLTEIRGNNIVETELAVATIIVVTEPEGLELDIDEDVVDYLSNGGTVIHATILPKGYTDPGLEIQWDTSDPTIATVTPSSDDSKTATVTYLKVGRVRITAQIKTAPSKVAFCVLDIQTGVSSITIDPESITMKVGEERQIHATVEPEDATDRSLTWESSDTSVATVNEYGLVTGIKAGTTVITITASNGERRQCSVTVLVPAEGIELNYYNITVRKGAIFYLSAKVLPEGAYDKAVTFSSSDEDLVYVENDGTVTARMVGTAEITVTSVDNPELTAVCVVTVTESVSGLTLNSRQETIKVGEQFLLKATVRPSDSLNQEVTFESADPSIATVDENGLITGVKGGVTVIIVKTVERGLMATCTITVQEDIESITMTETELYVAKGKNKRIGVTIQPESATQKRLIWTSSDESIAIVDAEGNVHGVNLGVVTVTATSPDEGKVSATCKVTVIDETTKITLNQTTIRLMERDTYQLTYTIEPNYATVQRVNWTTSDASVARVDSLGLVTAIGQGEAKIRATAVDGSGVYAECTVIVTPMILTTSVRVNSLETTMVVGDTRRMTARTMPRNTTEAIRWVSENPSVVTIDSDGNLRAVGPGVAQVTAISSVSGVEGSSTITVLGLNATSLTLEQYDTFDLDLDGTNTAVTWFSRNKRIATVTRRGVVTGRREGTTDIVARVGGKLVSCEVNVEKLNK